MNGKDIISLKVIEELQQVPCSSYKQIAKKFNVSLDSVKRIARYKKLLDYSEEKLSSDSVEKIKLLGSKCVNILTPLFSRGDYATLNNVLESVDERTTCGTLQALVAKMDKLVDRLTPLEFRLHENIERAVSRFLYEKRECVSVCEFVLEDRSRCDVAAYDKTGHIIIVDVKVSVEDFKRGYNEGRMLKYTSFCDEFYVSSPVDLRRGALDEYRKLVKEGKHGFLFFDGEGLEVIEVDRRTKVNVCNREQTIFGIARALWRAN